MIVFVVSRPGNDPENVILSADGREEAKRGASIFLEGDPDRYIVTPITKPDVKTVIILPRGRETFDG